MAFQWVFNNAESLSVNKRAIVGQTVTRNQTVRAVSRGSAIRRFTVKLPDGMRWTDVATYIQALDAADKFTKETIQINNSGYNSWMSRGDISSSATYTVICVEFPQWTIFARDQVSWSGPFVFYEALV
jgi:hypothetical protein